MIITIDAPLRMCVLHRLSPFPLDRDCWTKVSQKISLTATSKSVCFFVAVSFLCWGYDGTKDRDGGQEEYGGSTDRAQQLVASTGARAQQLVASTGTGAESGRWTTGNHAEVRPMSLKGGPKGRLQA